MLRTQRPAQLHAGCVRRRRRCGATACAAADAAWLWRGHRIAYTARGPADGPPCLLLHGFGLSSLQWRAYLPALAASGRRVYALDLLAFGQSDKPDVPYSIELWRDLVLDFAAEHTAGHPAGCIFAGHSIGALVAAAAAAEAPPATVSAVILLACAGGMNNSARTDDWRSALAAPLFALINALLLSPAARPLFDAVRKRDTIASLLRGVYAAAPERADDVLVDSVCSAAAEEGALGAAVRIITGPPGPRPEDLVRAIDVPLCAVWGDVDGLTPHDGPLVAFFAKLPSTRPNTRFHLLPGLGHCAFDEAPEKVLPLLEDFLMSLPPRP